MPNLDDILSRNLEKLGSENLLRETVMTDRKDDGYIYRGRRKLLSFSCNDYLGLSHNRKIIKASNTAATKYGVSAGASRLVTGNTPLYEKLEHELASLCGTEAALVFGSGYLANIGTIPSLVGPRDLIIADKLVHSCMLEGAILSGAELKRFAHNDMESFETIISKYRSNYNNCLVLTESVFSMDGDSPDLKRIRNLCAQHDSWLMTDHAHDLKHLQTNDRQRPSNNHIIMGTLSKAVGSYGGYVAGSQTLITHLKNSARSLVFTTGLPPSVLAASLKSLDIISKQQWRIEKTLDNARYFRKIVSENVKNISIDNSTSQIVPLVIGKAEDALKLSEHLYNKGFLVHAIRPPTVPANTSRLRFSFAAYHEKPQIDKLCKELIKYFQKK